MDSDSSGGRSSLGDRHPGELSRARGSVHLDERARLLRVIGDALAELGAGFEDVARELDQAGESERDERRAWHFAGPWFCGEADAPAAFTSEPAEVTCGRCAYRLDQAGERRRALETTAAFWLRRARAREERARRAAGRLP